ncbi:hypothetical protein MAY91_03180 [Edwardsiella ictaluri]|uniref:Uncharacterized protein n=1 Tax=Edwardsiella ictaluri TaxID=67780 RepID=A0ABY8GIA9_EDWIC|nr:hypothetical protein [Edwardsiella ictaluri]WFN97129.1 hypothetical protein MAY91_03180 [Edwardsiella ictaluri]
MSLWRALLLPVLALSLALAGYGLSGRAASVLQAQRLRDDPQRQFTPPAAGGSYAGAALGGGAGGARQR